MEHKWEKPFGEDRHRRRSQNPSFSSTLLDAIYRSIDDKEDLVVRKVEAEGAKGSSLRNEDVAAFKRTSKTEKKAATSTGLGFRTSSATNEATLENPSRKIFDRPQALKSSSSSSSDSSSGGGFSSSESESLNRNSVGASVACVMHFARREKTFPEKHQDSVISYPLKKVLTSHGSKQGVSSAKNNSRTSKIYSDLRKVKEPLSPGGRLASFLNSLFTGNGKTKGKAPSSSSGQNRRAQENFVTRKSNCSSASSISRSCLSEPPASREKSGVLVNGGKHSMSSYPVSGILNENSRQDKITTNSVVKPEKDERMFRLMTKNCGVEVARDILRNFQKSNDNEYLKEEDDDGCSSCASSDLFELDNLLSVGMDHRFSEELPVYETTHLGTKLAIANRLRT